MNVPKLRFSEFNDAWNTDIILNICESKKGNGLSKNDITDDGYDCILYGELYTKYNEVIRKVESHTKLNSPNFVKSKINDVIIPASGETPIDIAKASCVMLDNVILGGDLNVLTPNNIDGRFLSYQIGYKRKMELANLSQGNSVVHLYYDKFKNVKIKYPSIKEQNKIANIMELINKKIELQSKKIEDLKLYKKGLFYKLFYKFKTRKTYIKELGHIVTGTTPAKSETAFWDRGNITWVTPSDINEDKDIYLSEQNLTNKGLNKGRFIPKNSILVTCIASIGKNAILKVDGSCNQQINAIIPYENYNYDYIYYLINNLSNYMQSIAGTSATSIINKEAFSNIEVDVHNYDDQIKISNILNKIETKILLEKNKLNKLQQLKKGLMQSMFV